MSILCQFPGTRRIRAGGKVKEELKMFLLLRENGGWGSKQGGCFTDKPVVSMQSAVLDCRDTERWREREREQERLYWSACSLLPQRDKQEHSKRDRVRKATLLLLYSQLTYMEVPGTIRKNSSQGCWGVCCNITVQVCIYMRQDSFKAGLCVGWGDVTTNMNAHDYKRTCELSV